MPVPCHITAILLLPCHCYATARPLPGQCQRRASATPTPCQHHARAMLQPCHSHANAMPTPCCVGGSAPDRRPDRPDGAVSG
eukprot:3403678-Lingulodinium_polyedra.AAC.1